MKSLSGPLRHILINTALTLVLLFALNLLAAFFYDGRYLLQRWIVPVSDKAKSPSLADDPKHAYAIFRDFEMLRTRYEPYIAWSREPFVGETTTVGADGDRIQPSWPEAPRSHIRLFGGSTMWSKGVDDEGTIPAKLNTLRPDAAVHNHGESGFVSRQSLARLINLLNQNEPTDAVVFYDGCNDLYTLCRDDVSINGHSREVKIRAKMTPSSYTLNTLTGALREVIAYLLIQADIMQDAPSRCADDPAYARLVAETMVNNWKLAKVLASSRGIEFHAFLQPMAIDGSVDVQYLELESKAEAPRQRSTRSVYPIVQEIIETENKNWLHDLSGAFDGQGAIYIDGCHVNEKGNALIAAQIDEMLRAPDNEN